MIADFLIALIDIYTIVVIVRIVFSWMPPQARAGQFYEFLHAVTEPAMRPFRRVIPPLRGIVDLSPILLFLLLMVAKGIVGSVR